MKKQSGKKLKLVLVILAVMVIGLVGGAGMIFREELKIANSVRPVDGKEHVYYMEVDSDYHFGSFWKPAAPRRTGRSARF